MLALICALLGSGRVDGGTRQAICRVLLKWAGATSKTFWAAESQKSGVAPAHFCCLFYGAFRFWLLGDCCKHKDWDSRRVKTL